MKVYIVTAGEYSDYHIEAVFTDSVTARRYARLDTDRNVEEYDVDSISLEFEEKLMSEYNIGYNFDTNKLVSIHNTTWEQEDEVCQYESFLFYFHLHTDKRLYDDLKHHGTNSKLVLKIAQDRFAKWLAEHDISKEELIKIQQEKYYRFTQRYLPMQTIVKLEHMTPEDIDRILHEKLKNGETLPDVEEVRNMLFK